jgi:hypothetical protein
MAEPAGPTGAMAMGFDEAPIAELADAVFFAGQVVAIHADAMRALGAPRDRIDAATRHGTMLAALFPVLFGLIGREDAAKAAIAALLAGDAVPARAAGPDRPVAA